MPAGTYRILAEPCPDAHDPFGRCQEYIPIVIGVQPSIGTVRWLWLDRSDTLATGGGGARVGNQPTLDAERGV